MTDQDQSATVAPQDLRRELAIIGSEYWKLLKGFERAISLAPLEARSGLNAQLRYAASKLETVLESVEMRVVDFDGAAFEVNVPAVAINGDDFAPSDDVVVEKTLEPAVIQGAVVLVSGKVYLTKKN